MTRYSRLLALACVVPLWTFAAAQAEGKKSAKEPISYGILKAVPPETARGQALAWLKGTGKSDPATLKEFNALWSDADTPVLERVSRTLALGDPKAAKILAEAKDTTGAAPKIIPEVLKDAKQPTFYRANLALAYAKAISNRRVHEEALDALKCAKPEQVVDPAAYFFHRAVAAHALLLKNEANRSIVGVLEDVSDAPERYRMVSLLMYLDMMNWSENGALARLGSITRKMDNIERRLELARGGPKTRKMQKDVLARLDELIKELDKSQSGSNGGS